VQFEFGTITSKGQTKIPAVLRREFGLKECDWRFILAH